MRTVFFFWLLSPPKSLKHHPVQTPDQAVPVARVRQKSSESKAVVPTQASRASHHTRCVNGGVWGAP